MGSISSRVTKCFVPGVHKPPSARDPGLISLRDMSAPVQSPRKTRRRLTRPTQSKTRQKRVNTFTLWRCGGLTHELLTISYRFAHEILSTLRPASLICEYAKTCSGKFNTHASKAVCLLPPPHKSKNHLSVVAFVWRWGVLNSRPNLSLRTSLRRVDSIEVSVGEYERYRKRSNLILKFQSLV